MITDAVEKASEAMDSASAEDMGPTEDTVQALLEFLVEPVLPLKSSVRVAPSRSQQQLVAKQVHAVVLLYNYYHRKHNPALEFLDFESFCKLAVILKPTLMAHMKLMHRTDYTELDDVENHISITEKAIMDACDISSTLDASKDVPVAEGWPISKVAVLLVDSKRENCLLSFSSITSGVWSVIEKDVDAFNGSPECTVKGKNVSKRKRITRKRVKEEPAANETSLQDIVFSAVKEAAGINQSDLMVLESHVVYSLSKEKTAARFFVVQCTQPNYEDLDIPVKDVIESCRGPLVKKISRGWILTPAVKYFHVLPYAGILSDWISREVFSNSLQDTRVEVKNINVKIENPHDKEMTESRDNPISNQASRTSSPSPYRNDNYGKNLADSPYSMDANGSYMASPQNEDKINVKVELAEVNSVIQPCVAECRGEEAGIEDKFCSIISPEQDGSLAGDGAPVSSNPNHSFLEQVQATLSSKENSFSQTAMRVLYRKREKLARQLRNVENEIALCDRDIQTVQEGDDIDLALIIETIINASSDACVGRQTNTHDQNYQHVEDQNAPLSMERKKSSEAIPTLQNPCQELDDICRANNWKLPTYRVSQSDGKYLAWTTVKGVDFQFSSRSELHGSPRAARESAAAKTVAKLQRMITSE